MILKQLPPSTMRRQSSEISCCFAYAVLLHTEETADLTTNNLLQIGTAQVADNNNLHDSNSPLAPNCYRWYCCCDCAMYFHHYFGSEGERGASWLSRVANNGNTRPSRHETSCQRTSCVDERKPLLINLSNYWSDPSPFLGFGRRWRCYIRKMSMSWWLILHNWGES